jgi:hypothetical protein
LDPVICDEESKIQKIQNFCTEKFHQIKDILLEDNEAGGKTAEIAIKDLVSLLTYLYINSD